MARKGPWMIEVGRRCEACGGTGQIPDQEETRGVESARTRGGARIWVRTTTTKTERALLLPEDRRRDVSID